MLTKRVLIVDDALDFGRMLQATLSMINAGHMQISLVPSAEEAMLEISRLAPDLVVSDLRLPGISGFDLIRKIRARAGNVKIVIVTGLKDPGLGDQAARAGADLFFVKPLTMADFVAGIQRLLYLNETADGSVTQPDPLPIASILPSGVTDLLDQARSNLGALSVLLLDPGGAVLLCSGETPAKDAQTGAIPAALSAVKAGAALADLLDPSHQETVLAVKGRRADWVLSPLGDRALLIALPVGSSALRLPLAVEAALALRAGLLAALSPVAPPAAVQPEPTSHPAPAVAAQPVPGVTVESAPDVSEPDLGDLEDLFGGPASTPPDNAAAFWDQAVTATSARPSSESALTYDQAVSMGLTPGGED